MPAKKPRNADHVRHRNTPQADNEAITEHLKGLLSPAIYAQSAYYRSLGLRDRILNLSLMVAAILTLIWRQVPSVGELTRMLEQKELLWGKAVIVSQQGLSQRFLSFPSELFERVFHDLLPLLRSRSADRVGMFVKNDLYQQQSDTHEIILRTSGLRMAQHSKPYFVN